MGRVIIIQDDSHVCRLLINKLSKRREIETVVLQDVSQIFKFNIGIFDVVILPNDHLTRSGLFRLPRIRSSFEGIVVIVTSYRNDADECLALSSGADDYIYWDENELVLIERVRLYSRRLLRGRGAAEINKQFNESGWILGEFYIDAIARNVRFRNKVLPSLTAAEFDVLKFLIERIGEVVSRDELAYSALGRRFESGDRAIDGIICKIRRKICVVKGGGIIIHSLRNKGYMLSAEL